MKATTTGTSSSRPAEPSSSRRLATLRAALTYSAWAAAVVALALAVVAAVAEQQLGKTKPFPQTRTTLLPLAAEEAVAQAVQKPAAQAVLHLLLTCRQAEETVVEERPEPMELLAALVVPEAVPGAAVTAVAMVLTAKIWKQDIPAAPVRAAPPALSENHPERFMLVAAAAVTISNGVPAAAQAALVAEVLAEAALKPEQPTPAAAVAAVTILRTRQIKMAVRAAAAS